MKRQKTSKSVKSSKTKYKFDLKSNIIFEDSTSKNTKVQFIFDKDEPFYKHIYQEGK